MAQKALALDDSNSDALALLSCVDWLQRRFDQAVADGERAVAINPNDAQGYQALSDALMFPAGPKKQFTRSRRRSASILRARIFYAYFIEDDYVQMGRYQEAIPFLRGPLRYIQINAMGSRCADRGIHRAGPRPDARAEAAEFSGSTRVSFSAD